MNTIAGDMSLLNWQSTMVFSATDHNTVAWGAGTVTFANKSAYAIGAGNTGNMTTTTYIYLSLHTSKNTLQTSTTASDAVGQNKILIGVAIPNADAAKEAVFQMFGGIGGLNPSIHTGNIVAESITTTELAANAVTAEKIDVNDLSAISADLGSITAGNIVMDTSGFIRGGASAYASGVGYWLGYDTAAYKFFIGNSTGNNMVWDGSALTVTGALVTSTGSDIDGVYLSNGTVTAEKIATGTLTANEIAANTITAAEIAAGTITGTEIAANTITAGNIVANTITSAEIAAGTITTLEIAANTIVAGNIVAATITGTEIAANTITGANISAMDLSSKTITADQGTIGSWIIGATLLKSATSAERIELNQAENRISIFDAVNEKVAMGYLNGLAKNVGVGNWGVSDYGFWAKAGDSLQIDGDVTYQAGDWLIENDGSMLVKDSSNNTIIRLGTDTGEKGVFIYNTAGAQLAKYISDEIYIGTAGDDIRYTVAGGLVISGDVTITGGSGIANLSDAGSLATLDPGDVDQTALQNAAAAGATVGATWGTNISSQPTALSGINATEGTKLSGIATGATVGATWGTNLSSIPATLGTPGADGLYLSSTYMGYYKTSAWTTFIKNDGTFTFYGDANNSIVWGGTTLTVTGNIVIKNASTVRTAINVADGATAGATWGSNIGSQPTSLSGINATEGTKLSGVADGADVTSANTAANAASYTGSVIATTYTAAKCTDANADQTSAQFSNAIATIDATTDAGELGFDSNGNLVTKVLPASAIGADPGATGLFLGSDYMGYFDDTANAWKTYMDSSGNFYLGGTSGSLVWNGTDLTVQGTVNATAGGFGTGYNKVTVATSGLVVDAADGITVASGGITFEYAGTSSSTLSFYDGAATFSIYGVDRTGVSGFGDYYDQAGVISAPGGVGGYSHLVINADRIILPGTTTDPWMLRGVSLLSADGVGLHSGTYAPVVWTWHNNVAFFENRVHIPSTGSFYGTTGDVVLSFRDFDIYISSADDGHLDLTADTSIDLNGAVVGTSTMNVSADTDTAHSFGRLAFGYGAANTDYARVAHYDHLTATNYGLMLGPSGQTYLNAASGQKIEFRINNTGLFALQSDRIVPITTNTMYLGDGTYRWVRYYGVNSDNISSDMRLKTIARSFNYGTKEVMAIDPIVYYWKDDKTREHHLGFSAQQVMKYMPELVGVADDEMGTLALTYERLIPVLWKTVQEQQYRVTSLEEKLAA